MGWLDLHMHSNVSNDGEFSPQKLMELCAKADLKAAALTDHNSVRGVEEATYYANKLGIHLIPAIEIDCMHENVDLHLIGYGIDYRDLKFNKIEKDYESEDQKASKMRMQLIEEMGIYFNDDEVFDLSINEIVTGEMIGEVALKDERNKGNPLLEPFHPGGSRSDNPYVNFYWDFCSMGKQAYVPMKVISLENAVQAIQAAGGIGILAHPGINIGEDESYLAKIIQQGVVGIEAFSSYHNQSTTEFYIAQSQKHHLMKTVGSDFHGRLKPAIKLGSVSCQNREEEIYEMMVEKMEKHSGR